MPTVNEVIQDETIAHQEAMQQYSLGVVRRIIALLNRVDADLAAELVKALDRMSADSFTVERLEALLSSVRQLNAQAYEQVAAELGQDLQDVAAQESQWQFDLFDRVLPEPVKVRFPIARVTPQQAYAAAMSRPFQGRLLRDWVQTVEQGRMTAIRNAVRQGYMEGKTVAQIVSDIRGSRANAYADGFLQRPRKDLETVIRTAVSHIAAVSREQFTAANEDIIKAVRWVSTLDTKTSAECRIRDSLRYTAQSHKPIGHKVPWLQGPGRLHFNCRSTDTPVTKSWRELGIPIDEMTASERASMDGQVPADTTYGEWLKRQSAARQDQVLGPERAKMLRDGASMEDFYSQTGRWLTIDQLRARDSAAMQAIAA